jgi:hypothetical protein
VYNVEYYEELEYLINLLKNSKDDLEKEIVADKLELLLNKHARSNLREKRDEVSQEDGSAYSDMLSKIVKNKS